MTDATPNFEQAFKLYPAFAQESQEIGKIAVEAATGIAREQAQAFKDVLAYTTDALRNPHGFETDAMSARFDSHSELLNSLSERTGKIVGIAATAGEDCYNACVRFADAVSPASS